MSRFALVLIAVALAAPAHALTQTPVTFEQIVEEATAVVYARVAEVRGRWTSDRRAIESIVSLDALRYFKGDLGEHVAIRLPGGEAGGFVNVLPGAPVLREGDLVVLFLGSKGPAMPSILGLTQGVFRVAVDARAGTALVTPPPLKGSAAGRVIRGAADRRALTLDAFAIEVATIIRHREAVALIRSGGPLGPLRAQQ
jgi:hypothetical protein